jgi:hypothetical protein
MISGSMIDDWNNRQSMTTGASMQGSGPPPCACEMKILKPHL